MRVDFDRRFERNKPRSMVSANGKRLRVRAGAKPAAFQPTLQDLRTVEGYLAREIKRLTARHAEIARAIRALT